MNDKSHAVRFLGAMIACVAFVISVESAGGDEPTVRPNVLFIAVDDLRPELGCYGVDAVHSPNIDRLARSGVLFERADCQRADCQLAVCNPSRVSVMTGLRPDSTKVWDLVTRFRNTILDAVTLPQHFVKHGYFAASFGKIFHDPWPDNQSWSDPHRPCELGIGVRSGVDPTTIEVPACLPDNETVRGDMADYLWEVQRFDREVGQISKKLDERGELENTITVVSGDNGMPFPRCKATMFDTGTRVPLAIRWGAKVKAGRTVRDFVSLCNLAPTFLEAAGISMPEQMTGRSLMPILSSEVSGTVDPTRSFVLTGVERHVYSYPKRALRNEEFLYIRNFDPDQWLRLHRDDVATKRFADLSFVQHPTEEPYDLDRDPEQVTNVAGEPSYRATLQQLRERLDAELLKSGDPRAVVPGYSSRQIEGWPIRVSDALMETQPKKLTRALELLAEQLRTVKKLLPDSAIGQLNQVPIWLSPKYEGFGPTGEYHPSADWLRKQGRHPQLHRAIEFTNIPNFEREIERMPVLLLHELAHAFHHQVLGFDHDAIRTTFEIAKNNGSYDAVLRGNGKIEKAYAMSNDREYFAETTEAYFGRNDFYPFNRQELEVHDPRMAELLGRLWQVDEDP